jgi:hypothetical protein
MLRVLEKKTELPWPRVAAAEIWAVVTVSRSGGTDVGSTVAFVSKLKFDALQMLARRKTNFL